METRYDPGSNDLDIVGGVVVGEVDEGVGCVLNYGGLGGYIRAI